MISWSETKRRRNLTTHGFDFVGCETIFDRYMLVREDTRESYGEQRFKALGIWEGVVVALIYAEREGDIQVISIRKATKYETKAYFQARGY
ncbi:MAG: BrnT family toxin [Gammaproteobacteria bacterium]